jgi:hypothetical protein
MKPKNKRKNHTTCLGRLRYPFEFVSVLNLDINLFLMTMLDTLLEFNPLKTKRVCFIYGLSAYRAVNTLHFGYKNQSLNVL